MKKREETGREGRRKDKKEKERKQRKRKKRDRTLTRMSDDSVSKQRTTCTVTLWPLTCMSKVLCKNDNEGPIVES